MVCPKCKSTEIKILGKYLLTQMVLCKKCSNVWSERKKSNITRASQKGNIK